MNNNLTQILIVLCLIILSVSLAGCHIPGMNGKGNDAQAPAPETTGGENKPGDGAEAVPEVPEITHPEEPEEDEPLITNPSRSSFMPGKRNSGAAIISITEGFPLGLALYETASAVGTVGVTLGITPSLGIGSQVVMMILMFLGRVGGLTVVYAALTGSGKKLSKLPQEKIIVG